MSDALKQSHFASGWDLGRLSLEQRYLKLLFVALIALELRERHGELTELEQRWREKVLPLVYPDGDHAQRQTADTP